MSRRSSRTTRQRGRRRDRQQRPQVAAGACARGLRVHRARDVVERRAAPERVGRPGTSSGTGRRPADAGGWQSARTLTIDASATSWRRAPALPAAASGPRARGSAPPSARRCAWRRSARPRGATPSATAAHRGRASGTRWCRRARRGRAAGARGAHAAPCAAGPRAREPPATGAARTAAGSAAGGARAAAACPARDIASQIASQQRHGRVAPRRPRGRSPEEARTRAVANGRERNGVVSARPRVTARRACLDPRAHAPRRRPRPARHVERHDGRPAAPREAPRARVQHVAGEAGVLERRRRSSRASRVSLERVRRRAPRARRCTDAASASAASSTGTG